jgi:transcriptional regulator with XRE-family HTH domain
MKLEQLRRLRMAKGYTQTEFAKKLGIDRSYYNQIELNKAKPSLKLLEQIAVELDKSLKDFF